MNIKWRKFLRALALACLAVPAGNPAVAQEESLSTADVFSIDGVFKAADAFFEGQDRDGLRRVLEQAYADMGPPEAYFYGTEDEGIIEIGYRYGEGALVHKGVGTERIYWKGPSLAFELARNSKVFGLVYNLHDYKSFYKRFAPGESGYFFYKGAALSYRKRLEMTLAQIRVGVEVSEGLSPAWVKFSSDELVVPNVLPK